ncbi:family 43 glycosylhydrolase [Paenibacillus sp. FSL M7-0420]|uniref:family 43 glycosylhydrolase n=1 Tax=Paenibacillus sp. FSL M7-0420 TaxID=2921609 RepID=UPI0030FBA7E2
MSRSCGEFSEPVLLSKLEYSWENNYLFVDEGPYPLFSGDKLYITFSRALVDYTYNVGYLSIDRNADLLNITNWTKGNYPLLTSSSVPGHNAHVTQEGMVWSIYHARIGKEGPRYSGVRRVHFHQDGFPILDMTENKDIQCSSRKLSFTLKVHA